MSEENKKLLTELNALMHTDLEGFDEDNKVFPYLGWYWRDIPEYEAKGITVSFLDGLWWLDEARKWSYPSKRLSVEETNKALKLWIAIAKANVEYAKFSNCLADSQLKGEKKNE